MSQCLLTASSRNTVSTNESTNKHAQKRDTRADLGDIGLGRKLELVHDHDSGCPSTNSLAAWEHCLRQLPSLLKNSSPVLFHDTFLVDYWLSLSPLHNLPQDSFFKDCLPHLIPLTC